MLKPQRGKGFGSMKKGNVLDGAVVAEDVKRSCLGAVLFVARAVARLFATSNIFLFIHGTQLVVSVRS